MDDIRSTTAKVQSDNTLLYLYFSLACFARTATGAAIVGILILASENGVPSHQMGILAACLSAPSSTWPDLGTLVRYGVRFKKTDRRSGMCL